MGQIRVLIADHEALVRRALQLFVDADEDLKVVAEASDDREAFDLSVDLRPDVLLLNILMPDGDGLDTIARLSSHVPSVRTIALTTFGSDETVLAAMRRGAAGFLVRDSEPAHITAAIRSAHHGGTVLSAAARIALIRTAGLFSARQPTRVLSEGEHVSPREREVIKLLAQGMSNAEIGRTLFLSEATTKSHLRRIMAKWSARDRLQVLLYAASVGLVDVP